MTRTDAKIDRGEQHWAELFDIWRYEGCGELNVRDKFPNFSGLFFYGKFEETRDSIQEKVEISGWNIAHPINDSRA